MPAQMLHPEFVNASAEDRLKLIHLELERVTDELKGKAPDANDPRWISAFYQVKPEYHTRVLTLDARTRAVRVAVLSQVHNPELSSHKFDVWFEWLSPDHNPRYRPIEATHWMPIPYGYDGHGG